MNKMENQSETLSSTGVSFGKEKPYRGFKSLPARHYFQDISAGTHNHKKH
jgi:hypothetical protein